MFHISCCLSTGYHDLVVGWLGSVDNVESPWPKRPSAAAKRIPQTPIWNKQIQVQNLKRITVQWKIQPPKVENHWWVMDSHDLSCLLSNHEHVEPTRCCWTAGLVDFYRFLGVKWSDLTSFDVFFQLVRLKTQHPVVSGRFDKRNSLWGHKFSPKIRSYSANTG